MHAHEVAKTRASKATRLPTATQRPARIMEPISLVMSSFLKQKEPFLPSAPITAKWRMSSPSVWLLLLDHVYPAHSLVGSDAQPAGACKATMEQVASS